MKLMDKLIINKKLFLFLIIFSLIAIIFGSIFTVIIGKDNSLTITSKTTEFITEINKLNYLESFKNVFSYNLLFLIIIWLIGISIIGIPITLILFFIKTFSLGFTISSFILTYKVKGLLINAIYIIPCQIINLIISIYLISFSLIISFKLLESIIKKKSVNFNFISGYKKILFITIFVFLLSNLYEVFIMPNILNIVLHLIK